MKKLLILAILATLAFSIDFLEPTAEANARAQSEWRSWLSKYRNNALYGSATENTRRFSTFKLNLAKIAKQNAE